MAELKVKVTVDKKQLNELDSQIKKIKQEAKEIKIDITAATKAIDAAKKLADANKAVETATTKRITAEVNLAKQLSKTAQAEAKASAEEQKTAREREKSTQTANRLAAAREKTTQTQTRKEIEELRNLRKEMGLTENAASKFSGVWKSMFSQFSMANIISSGVTRAIATMRSAFNEALKEMKALDLAATHYQQVMGSATTPEATQLLTKQAYSVGSKYGTSASDYMESVATYARAGYKETAEALAELSMKTVIVGQTTQEVADQFLLTMDTAYKYGGSISELSKVLDGASAIDSEYATTIEKIATGLGLVAPLAQQVHVSEAELTAAIGTITAATQRSGSEAARALRSLFLNIIKDTTTEIEDGVTATEESVASVQYLLERYAKSAVDAAKATGQVVNPMEAIAALSKSMKEGLLTEQELMNLLSGIGGKLRISQLVALVSNWDMYTNMIGTYENAMGSADQKTEQYLNSWEAKTNILKNTWTEFVAKTLNSDLIKGILDAGTKILTLIGDLQNGIVILAGAVATIKLAKASAELKKLSRTMEDAGKAAATAGRATAMGWAAVIVGAITAVASAYNAYHNQRMQQLEAERDERIDAAQAEKESLDKIDEAYDAFVNARTLLWDGKISVEDYEAATRNLADALGIENEALAENLGLIERRRNEQRTAAKDSIREAIGAARIAADTELHKIDFSKWDANWHFTLNPYENITSQWDLYQAGKGVDYKKHLGYLYGLGSTRDVDEAIKYYQKLKDIQKEYLENYNNKVPDFEKYKQGYNEISSVLSVYEGLLEPIIKLQEEYKDVLDDTVSVMSADEVLEFLDRMAASAEEAANPFHELADAIKSADAALAQYQSRTESEKDDDYKKYAEAWQKAFEDIQAGRKNSNAVNAALDLFFTPEQIMNMRKRGVEAADVIASDFYKTIFTYMDENGEMQFTKGMDSGTILAYTLYDNIAQLQEDGKKVITLGDEVVASFEEIDGQLQLNVTDVNDLSLALSQLGIDLDPDVLTVWLEGLGVFTDGFMYSADVVKEFANDVGALKDNKIDLEALIVGRLQLGETTKDVANLLDNVVAMAEAGEIELTVSGDELDSTKEACEEIITQRDDLDENGAEVEVEANTAAAKAKLDVVKSLLEGISKSWTANFSVNTSGIETLTSTISMLNQVSGHRALSARGYASGTTSASGGLALVNEEAPELIVENGAARIAGSGMPTLTYLASGATVFNARETKNILGGSYPANLFDGINAYASGTKLGYSLNGIQRWTPPSSGSSGGSASSGASSGGSSASYASSSGSSSASSSGSSSSSSSSSSSDKNPQLEALEKRVSLLKSELSLLEERDVSLDSQIDKQREIQKAIQDQIIYLSQTGGEQEKINNLWTEYWKIENDVRSDRLEKAKGELDILEASKRPIREQIEKQREIATIYKEKLDILQQTGGSQIEINNLLKEELAISESIAKLNKELLGDLSDAIDNEIDVLNKERDDYVDGLQKQIDALKEEREAQKAVNEEEELNQQLIKARNDLMNAQNERTVRQYNAATGQWEWVADAQQVKSAQDAYKSAQKSLADYLDESAFNAKIDALTAEQERYTKLYADKTDKWQEILGSMEDPVMTIAEALQNIEDNATRDMKGQIVDLNKMLAPLGYSISTEKLYDSGGILSGIGGIKATYADEAILPPDVTAKLLKPIQPAMFEQRMNELRYLYGANGMNLAGSMGNGIGSQHNGDLYTFGNVTLTTEQAQNTTIYDFVQAAKGLRAYSARM